MSTRTIVLNESDCDLIINTPTASYHLFWDDSICKMKLSIQSIYRNKLFTGALTVEPGASNLIILSPKSR